MLRVWRSGMWGARGNCQSKVPRGPGVGAVRATPGARCQGTISLVFQGFPCGVRHPVTLRPGPGPRPDRPGAQSGSTRGPRSRNGRLARPSNFAARPPVSRWCVRKACRKTRPTPGTWSAMTLPPSLIVALAAVCLGLRGLSRTVRELQPILGALAAVAPACVAQEPQCSAPRSLRASAPQAGRGVPSC